ncbi:STARD3 N-terminal-like protein isoform X3 [Lepidochelys kempii]|uniref:STARD3 N-terminal-like protein isoform X3 n=1 Tax=Lepidochelys kempii TaxID=8472 RepID=UPI003C6ECFAE
MNRLPDDAENAQSSSRGSCPSLQDVHSINPAQLMARIESYEGREKKGISDVRRTFCLFVTFDLLFVTLLWIIELNVNGGIETTLEKEVLQYDYHSSYFDIFLLAVFRFNVLILAYAMCRLRHWWAIAFTTAVTSAFLLAKVILSKGSCWCKMRLSEQLFFSQDTSLMGSFILLLNLQQDLMKNLKKNRIVKNQLYSNYER